MISGPVRRSSSVCTFSHSTDNPHRHARHVDHDASAVLGLAHAQLGPSPVGLVVAAQAHELAERSLLSADTGRAALEPSRTSVDAAAQHDVAQLTHDRGAPGDPAGEERDGLARPEDVQPVDPVLGHHARHPGPATVVLVRLEGLVELPCHPGNMGRSSVSQPSADGQFIFFANVSTSKQSGWTRYRTRKGTVSIISFGCAPSWGDWKECRGQNHRRHR